MLEACLAVLGRDQIELVLGDREFVGHAWFKWLQDKGLPFVMRLPKHHHLTLASGECRAVAALGLAPGQVRRFAHVQVDGVWGQALVKALDGGQFLFLFGSGDLPDLAPLYARRWRIEQCFQNLKGRGFNLENTHLRCHLKLRKLVALVSLAYALCLSVGQDAAEHSPPIARKKHGYRATSLSRHGLNILRQITRPATASTDALARQVMALLNWLISQVACYQRPGKMAG